MGCASSSTGCGARSPAGLRALQERKANVDNRIEESSGGQAFEPVAPDESAGGQSATAVWSARKRWTSSTAIAPSPTAAATRLVEPRRTSPAANTPGRDVSSGYGSHGSGHTDRAPVSERLRSSPAGDDVPGGVDENAGVAHPGRVGLAADADEQGVGLDGVVITGAVVPQGDRA